MVSEALRTPDTGKDVEEIALNLVDGNSTDHVYGYQGNF